MDAGQPGGGGKLWILRVLALRQRSPVSCLSLPTCETRPQQQTKTASRPSLACAHCLASSSSWASLCPDGSWTQGWSWEGHRQCLEGVQEGADRIPAGQCGGREGQEAKPRREALQAPGAALGICGLSFLPLKRWKEYSLHISSAQFSRSVVSDSFQPHGLQHTRSPCPSPIPGVYSNSCPLSW